MIERERDPLYNQSYTIMELITLVREFTQTHPQKEEGEFFAPINQLEARCTFNFLAWLAAGKTFPEDNIINEEEDDIL